jgi:hypothetical protein
MDDPTQLVFADPSCVTDRAGQRLLVNAAGSQSHPSYANFDVSIEVLWSQIEAFLKALKL